MSDKRQRGHVLLTKTKLTKLKFHNNAAESNN